MDLEPRTQGLGLSSQMSSCFSTVLSHNRMLKSYCSIICRIFLVLCGSFNPGLDLKVSRGHGLGTPPWYRSIPDGTNIYYVFKTGLDRTYDKSLME